MFNAISVRPWCSLGLLILSLLISWQFVHSYFLPALSLSHVPLNDSVADQLMLASIGMYILAGLNVCCAVSFFKPLKKPPHKGIVRYLGLGLILSVTASLLAGAILKICGIPLEAIRGLMVFIISYGLFYAMIFIITVFDKELR